MTGGELLLLVAVVGGGVGGLLGHFVKGRAALGVALGILLGPIGWLTLLVMGDGRKVCPECRGVVPDGAKRCKHYGELLPIHVGQAV